MADAPTPTADSGDPNQPPAPTGEPKPVPTSVIQPDDSDTLRDAGKRALEAERAGRTAAEKNAAELQKQIDTLNRERMSDTERAVAEAKDSAVAEAIKPMQAALVRSEMKAAAKGVLADPTDAARYLNPDDFLKDGVVDDKAIDKAIAALIKDRPHLKAGATLPGSIDGGTRPPAPPTTDMNDLIRRQRDARRGVLPTSG